MFDRISRRFADWSRIRSDIQRLKHMDDGLLADMGIAREDISRLLRKGRK